MNFESNLVFAIFFVFLEVILHDRNISMPWILEISNNSIYIYHLILVLLIKSWEMRRERKAEDKEKRDMKKTIQKEDNFQNIQRERRRGGREKRNILLNI